MGCYKIGKTPPQWSSKAQTITFVVTEDCNLRCKYCYITHKASNKKMSFETAKKFIDYILTADIEQQIALSWISLAGSHSWKFRLSIKYRIILS